MFFGSLGTALRPERRTAEEKDDVAG